MLQGFDSLYLGLCPGEVFQNVNHLRKEVWQLSRCKILQNNHSMVILCKHTCSLEKYPWTCSIALIRWSVKTHFRTKENMTILMLYFVCLFNNNNKQPHWSPLPPFRTDNFYCSVKINGTFLISSKTISKDFLSIFSVAAPITVLIINPSYSISMTILHSPADWKLHAVTPFNYLQHCCLNSSTFCI